MKGQFISPDNVCPVTPFWGEAVDMGFLSEPVSSFGEDINSRFLSNGRFRAYQPCSDYSNTTSGDLLLLSNVLYFPIAKVEWIRNFRQKINCLSFVAMSDSPREAVLLDSIDSLTATQPEICITEIAISFMDNLGLKDEINSILRVLINNYLTLKTIMLDVKCDPEIANRRYLRFTLTISGKPSDILEQEQKCRRIIYEKLGTNIFELLTINYRWS